MASLEQTFPSWLSDGLGVVGLQTDISLDNDMKWDTVAWSKQEKNKEDFISCCPVTCPDTITMTYHDLVFDCGCKVLQVTGSIIATDVDLSGRSVTLRRRTENICAPLFGWGTDGVDFCSYESAGWSGSAPLHAVTYGTTDCTGPPLEDGDAYPSPKVLMLFGVWYVWDYFQMGAGDSAIFLGSTLDRTSPISNTLACSDPVDRSGLSPIIDCHGPNLIGGIPVVPGVAHDGTVTLTF